MKTNYNVAFKMAGGTTIKEKQFVRPAGVVYYVSQCVPKGATEVKVDVLNTGATATYEVKNGTVSRTTLDGLKAFLGGV